ncbi:hypothetical protein GN956_G17060 [Arapaima gigas]
MGKWIRSCLEHRAACPGPRQTKHKAEGCDTGDVTMSRSIFDDSQRKRCLLGGLKGDEKDHTEARQDQTTANHLEPGLAWETSFCILLKI